jgi:hypothetical protein
LIQAEGDREAGVRTAHRLEPEGVCEIGSCVPLAGVDTGCNPIDVAAAADALEWAGEALELRLCFGMVIGLSPWAQLERNAHAEHCDEVRLELGPIQIL